MFNEVLNIIFLSIVGSILGTVIGEILFKKKAR